MFGLARIFLGAAAKRGAATTAAATAERGLLGRVFGFAGRHPVMTTGAAVVADQKYNDGRGTSAAFNTAKDAVMPNSAADWMKYGAFGLAAKNLLQGNVVKAGIMGYVGYHMNDILGSEIFQNIMEALDKFSNETLNIDIPDNWYKQFANQDAPAPAAAPALAPA